jgi:hypothetical protein
MGTSGSVDSTPGNITGASVATSAGDVIAIQASGNGINNGTGSMSVSLHCH